MKMLKLFTVVLLAAFFIVGCGPKIYDFNKMSDEDIVALYNSAPKFHKNDIDETMGNIWVLDSVSSEDEARSIFDEEFENDYNVITACNKVFENERYLLFDVSWLYLNEYPDTQRCLLFKRDFYDSVTRTVGDISSDAIKEIFDLHNYSYMCSDTEAKILQSNVKKEGTNYIYRVSIFYKWQEFLSVQETTVTIDAQTGKVVDETYSTVKERIVCR